MGTLCTRDPARGARAPPRLSPPFREFSARWRAGVRAAWISRGVPTSALRQQQLGDLDRIGCRALAKVVGAEEEGDPVVTTGIFAYPSHLHIVAASDSARGRVALRHGVIDHDDSRR